MSWRILVPQLGVKPVPPAVEAVLTTGTSGKFHKGIFLMVVYLVAHLCTFIKGGLKNILFLNFQSLDYFLYYSRISVLFYPIHKK